MIKRAITFVLIFYVVSTIFQWLFRSEIRWTENIAISILAFFFFILFDWLFNSKKRKEKAESRKRSI